jgi:hypothetical protein
LEITENAASSSGDHQTHTRAIVGAACRIFLFSAVIYRDDREGSSRFFFLLDRGQPPKPSSEIKIALRGRNALPFLQRATKNYFFPKWVAPPLRCLKI